MFDYSEAKQGSVLRITDKQTRATRETRGVVMHDIVNAFIVLHYVTSTLCDEFSLSFISLFIFETCDL